MFVFSVGNVWKKAGKSVKKCVSYCLLTGFLLASYCFLIFDFIWFFFVFFVFI